MPVLQDCACCVDYSTSSPDMLGLAAPPPADRYLTVVTIFGDSAQEPEHPLQVNSEAKMLCKDASSRVSIQFCSKHAQNDRQA